MKSLVFIFSFYILFISCMPCTDVPCFEKKGGLSSINSTCSNPHEDETCSPFCVCFCCGSLAVNATMFSAITRTEFIESKMAKDNPVKINNISFSIWQPPKIV